MSAINKITADSFYVIFLLLPFLRDILPSSYESLPASPEERHLFVSVRISRLVFVQISHTKLRIASGVLGK